MTFLSLFAGIGGFDLGFERAGLRCVGQVEIDPWCRRVLAKHWPDVPKWDDVTTFTGEGFERPDVICGGFPCQDISVAGKRAGIGGKRSGLWGEYHRIICQVRPRFVVVENVSALLVRGMDRVLGDLAASGYDAEWDCLPACAFGSPQQRDRLFLVAYPSQVAGRCRFVFDGSHGFPRNVEWSSSQGVESGRGWKRWLVQASAAVDGKISASDFCGVDDGLSEELDRVGMFGNAVVPQVAEWIGRRLMETQKGRA